MDTLKNSMEKYVTLFPTDESKDTFKRYEEWQNKIRYHSKIRDLIESITNNSDNYDKKNKNQI